MIKVVSQHWNVSRHPGLQHQKDARNQVFIVNLHNAFVKTSYFLWTGTEFFLWTWCLRVLWQFSLRTTEARSTACSTNPQIICPKTYLKSLKTLWGLIRILRFYIYINFYVCKMFTITWKLLVYRINLQTMIISN